MTQSTDPLAYLENQMGLVCDNKACTAQAVYIVYFHRINECNKPAGSAGFYLLCPHCTSMTAVKIAEIVFELHEQLEYCCPTCEIPIEGVHSVFGIESLIRRP